MVEEFENGWLDMSLAPKDGTQILVAYNNDCSWDYFVVWWYRQDEADYYPWNADHNAYPEDKFSAWKSLEGEPYEIH